MSAFYVGERHINWLISYATVIGLKLPFSEAKLGEILSKENDNSLFYRYPNDGNEYSLYKWKHELIVIDNKTHIQAVKACDCYSYQSCEHPEWESSLAYKFINELKEKARTHVQNIHSRVFEDLYDEAHWGLDNRYFSCDRTLQQGEN